MQACYSTLPIYHRAKWAFNRPVDNSEIRLANLRILIREAGTAAALAERTETNAAYLSQLRIGTKTPRGTKTRAMGDELARKLEAGMGKPRGWMDHLHPELMEERGTYNVEDGPSVRQLLPLISWVRAGHWSEVTDPFAPGEYEARVAATKVHSPRSFALRVIGDSMEPEFPEGIIITIDPLRAAQHKSFVIVRQNGDTEATFKQLMIEGGRRYLKPLNQRYPIMEMSEDAVIVGVVRQQIRDYE